MAMIINIYDVGHGACAVVTSPSGRRIMFDCGHDDDRPWWPSLHYAGKEIEELVISNYDEDHVSDFTELLRLTKIAYISRNATVSAIDLGRLKMEMGMGNGIGRLQQWMASVDGKVFSGGPDHAPLKRAYYYNRYSVDFDDENNLSVVTFIEWSDFRIVFSGDLEIAGWKKLLQRPDFVRELQHINVFVASHHGRFDGCCDEVFNICHPQLVIMSDSCKQFETQETNGWYKARCAGIRYGNENRYVFTTRNDGDIEIVVGPTSWTISSRK